MKKVKFSKIILSLCALPALSSALVIGDFETGDDGWGLSAGASGASVTSTVITTGANAGSLEIFDPTGTFTFGSPELSIFGNTEIISILTSGNAMLSLDITADPSDVPTGLLGVAAYVNGDPGGSGFSTALLDGESGVITNVSVDGLTQTITYAVTDEAVALLNDPLLTRAVIGLRTNSLDERTFYLDNIQVTAIPEPSTIGLIAGLGCIGIAVMRRRRK